MNKRKEELRKIMLNKISLDYINYPPKSSKRTFSSGIPQSSANFKTAWFIKGGPQKYNSISSGASW